MTLYQQFIHDVQTNPNKHNKFVKLSVGRHLKDLKSKRWYFDESKADRIISIVKMLRHTSGSFGGKHFDLQPFQAFVLAMLFGWTDPNTGYRRFKKAYIEMARKGGKSELAAAIEIIGAFFDGEHAAQVYTVANTRDQAGYVYNAAREMCKRLSKDSAKFGKNCRILQYKIQETNTNGYITRLTADAGTNDGANPHVAVVDEYHSAKDDAMLKVVETGMGGRTQPLLTIITTAGFNKNGPCYAFRKVMTDMLEGKVENDNLFGIIWTLDEGDDYNDQTTWIKANPNLGNTPRIEQMQSLYQAAITEGSSALVEFMTKNLNQWVDAAKVWIKDEDWMSVASKVQDEGRCIIGLDLSSRTDLTAVTYFFPDSESFIIHYYAPLDKVRGGRRPDGVDYVEWAKDGYLTATPGNVIDYEYIINDVLNACRKYNVELIGYDPYNADLIIPKFQAEGITCGAVRQGFLTLSPATKRLETMVLSGAITHNGDPVTRWMVGNVEIEMDAAGNIKPSKSKSQNKIDGIASLVTAIAAWMSTEVVAKTEEITLEQLKAMYG
jgi:phage terminase large subunit-like protein